MFLHTHNVIGETLKPFRFSARNEKILHKMHKKSMKLIFKYIGETSTVDYKTSENV